MSSFIDFVPTFRERSRLDHLDLAVSSQQMCDTISYLSTHSIKTQSPTINLLERKVVSYTISDIHVKRLLGAVAVLLAVAEGDYLTLISGGIAIGADYFSKKKTKTP